jgi:hypothetical protein
MYSLQFSQLIKFIDFHTHNGLISHETEPWGEGIGLEEEGVSLINSFITDDWLSLEKLIKEKTDLWIKCSIDLLYGADSLEARQMLIYIALNGTEENFLDAMECIHYFKQEVAEDILLKFKARSDLIIRKRLNLKSYDK